jgi:hypothetical protein
MKMAFLTAAPLIQPDDTAGVIQSFERGREMYSLSLAPVKAPSAILMARTELRDTPEVIFG